MYISVIFKLMQCNIFFSSMGFLKLCGLENDLYVGRTCHSFSHVKSVV